MAGESSLADQVKTLQGYMGKFAKAIKDLTERVKVIEEKRTEDEDKDIKEIVETQRVIDEILVSNSDAIKRLNRELLKAQEANAKKSSETVNVDAAQHEIVRNHNKRKCRYYNRGHCKYRDRCKFNHSEHICQVYLDSGKCEVKNCVDRHPKVCKFWTKSKSGCIRKTSCDFLHVTLAKDDQREKEEPGYYNCVGCRCDWTDKSCVIEHVINDHRVYFCLNCEDWVKDKSKVLDKNWTMFDERGNLRYDV